MLRDPKNMLTIQTPLSDEEALDLLREKANTGDTFALALWKAYHEIRRHGPAAGQKMGWTNPQAAWAHHTAMRVLAARTIAQPSAPTDFSSFNREDVAF